MWKTKKNRMNKMTKLHSIHLEFTFQYCHATYFPLVSDVLLLCLILYYNYILAKHVQNVSFHYYYYTCKLDECT